MVHARDIVVRRLLVIGHEDEENRSGGANLHTRAEEPYLQSTVSQFKLVPGAGLEPALRLREKGF